MSVQFDHAFLRRLPLTLGAIAVFTLSVSVAQAADDSRERAEIAKRIAPIGKVSVAAEKPAETAAPATGPVGSAAASVAETAGKVVDTAVGAVTSMAAAMMPGGDSGKGKSTYDSVCFACHTTGAAGAPMLGNKDAWAPRIAQGMDALYTSALNGKNGMPPKGGRMDLPDADIKAAVDYIVSQSK